MSARDIFVDTGVWVAGLDAHDGFHARARGLRAVLEGSRLVTSDLVLSEAVTLLRRAGDAAAVVRFGRGLMDETLGSVEFCTRTDIAAGLALIERYDDQKLSLTDATSFVLVRRLGIKRVASFDKHFRIVLADREILS